MIVKPLHSLSRQASTPARDGRQSKAMRAPYEFDVPTLAINVCLLVGDTEKKARSKEGNEGKQGEQVDKQGEQGKQGSQGRKPSKQSKRAKKGKSNADKGKARQRKHKARQNNERQGK